MCSVDSREELLDACHGLDKYVAQQVYRRALFGPKVEVSHVAL